MKRRPALPGIVLSVLILGSCISFEDIALDAAADALSSGGGSTNIFVMDDDPALIADALPLALKLYEMVLMSRPEHPDLQFATGKNFVMYANAFIQTPAGMLPDEEFREQEKMLVRAKKMYIRGRDYLLNSIELKYPGFMDAAENGDLDSAIAMVDDPADTGLLYWAASGWIGAYSCDPFDFEMASDVYVPAAMLLRALELDGDYSSGAIHDVLIQLYASLPYSHIIKAAEAAPQTTGRFNEEFYAAAGTGSDPAARTDFHYNESLRLSGGSNPGTYCTYASSVCVKKQDYREYKRLLEKALEIDPAAFPENELVITIYREKAAWLLEHAEDYFILDSEDF